MITKPYRPRHPPTEREIVEQKAFKDNVEGGVGKYLQEIERLFRVTIVYACESGSRAWGFHSQDSDYDVRFIYIKPVNKYIAVDDGALQYENSNTMERFYLNRLVDMQGWDFRKTCQLMVKSNPPLLEWLNSPIIYRSNQNWHGDMQRLSQEYYSIKSCMKHYHSMAEGNYNKYLKNPEVIRKKYLYVLRPVLALRFIEATGKNPPMEMGELIDATLNNHPIKERVWKLIQDKRHGKEMGVCTQDPYLNKFLKVELERWKYHLDSYPDHEYKMDSINQFFYKTLLAHGGLYGDVFADDQKNA